MNGSNGGCASHPDLIPQRIRFNLLKDCLTSNDVLLLQEVTFKRLITKAFDATHHIIIPGNDVGILLSKKLFTLRQTFSGGDLQRVLDSLNHAGHKTLDTQMEASRILCASVECKLTDDCILFVSYHGTRLKKARSKSCALPNASELV